MPSTVVVTNGTLCFSSWPDDGDDDDDDGGDDDDDDGDDDCRFLMEEEEIADDAESYDDEDREKAATTAGNDKPSGRTNSSIKTTRTTAKNLLRVTILLRFGPDSTARWCNTGIP
jgi:hypothetical protein